MTMHRRPALPLWAFAAVAPFMIVKAAAWLIGSSTTASNAAAVPTPAVRDADPAVPPLASSPAQAAALAWDATLDLGVDVPTPFTRARPTAPLRDVAAEALSRFVVSAIVVSDRGAFASINREPRRVGDSLDAGWRITAIDPANLTVTLANVDGTQVILHVQR